MEEQTAKRPTGLVVTCVLSGINIVLAAMGSLMSIAHGPLSSMELKEAKLDEIETIKGFEENGMADMADLMERIGKLTEILNEHVVLMSTITFIATVLGGIGVYFMFQGRKQGFQFYIIYSLLAIFVQYFFASASDIPTVLTLTNCLISGLFIFIYSRFLSWMK